jgi:ABC-2 type transport system ATP-binding protein
VCALAGDPDLLFLDEPTTGLDPQGRRQLWELIEQFKHGGRTIVITTHYMEEAERLCDRVAIMDHGKVIAPGAPGELIASIGAEHIVEFSAGSAAKTLEMRALRGIDGVRAVTAENAHVRMPGEDHRSGFRCHEPGDDANVGGSGVLLRTALSRHPAAGHQSPSPDGRHRRSAREHVAGREPRARVSGGSGAHDGMAVCFALAMMLFRWR